MGAPESGFVAAEQPTADALLSTLRTIKEPERARHVGVLDYWLSIRGDKDFPPLHDLDPLEISDAAPCSILLELIGGGQDAEIRHLGEALKEDITVQRVIDASSPSLLSCIGRKLPIVAISRDFIAFEDNFSNADGLTRCWVTLLPLSSCGSWVDYVYAFVSLEKSSTKTVKPAQPVEAVVEPAVAEEAEAVVEEVVAEEAEPVAVAVAEEAEAVAEVWVEPESLELEELVETVAEVEASAEPEPAPEPDAEQPAAKGAPGFSKLIEGFANLTGFYGQGIKVPDPVVPMEITPSEPPVSEPPLAEVEPEPEPLELDAMMAIPEPEAVDPPALQPELEPEPVPELVAEQPPLELVSPAPAALEGSLQNQLSEVRAKADEARQAALRATTALHEGLSAAYDFALDAETSPEEYFRLIEAQGLKIQLRAPMAPVARLAFDGLVDPATLGQCEQILAWALKQELPRGDLLVRIDRAGGISELAGEVAGAV